jgi:hypothetical protein
MALDNVPLYKVNLRAYHKLITCLNQQNENDFSMLRKVLKDLYYEILAHLTKIEPVSLSTIIKKLTL